MKININDNIKFISLSFCLIALFLITQNFAPLSTSILNFGDQEAYKAISECNNFPNCKNLGNLYQSQLLERWFPHIIMGKISNAISIESLVIYRYCLFIIFILFILLISKLQIDWYNKICIFALVGLWPYSMRLYFFAPYMLSDALFFTSILSIVISIIIKNNNLLIISIIIAAFSRQTSIILLPILVFLYFNKNLNRKILFISSLVLIGVFFINQLLTKIIFNTTIGESTLNHLPMDHWARLNFVSFFKMYIDILFIIILLVPLLILNTSKKNYTTIFVFISMICAQPILTGGGNLFRLMSFAIPVFVFMFDCNGQKLKIVYKYILLVFLLSFHHHYSIIESKNIFLAIAIICFFYSVYIFNNKKLAN